MRDNWVSTTIGEIADVIGGGTPSTKSPKFWNGDVVWLTPTEVVNQEGRTISDSIRKISKEGLAQSGAKLLPRGTVILSTRASVGFAAMAGCELATNQGFQSLVPHPEVDPWFLLYWVQGNRSEFESRSAGSTFKEISNSNVRSIKISLPPRAVQKRIVDLVSSVDAYIDALQRQADEARTARTAVLADLLSKGGPEWIETTIGAIADVVGGGTPSTKNLEFWNGEVVWLTPTEVVSQEGRVISDSARRISMKGLNSSSAKLLPKGSVILTTRASVGYAAISGCELTTNQGFQSLIPRKGINPWFLMYWIQANRAEFESRSAGSTFKEISNSNVRSIRLKVPPLEVQERLVGIISSIDDFVGALNTTISAAGVLRSGLLSSLLSGEHEIPKSYDQLLGAA